MLKARNVMRAFVRHKNSKTHWSMQGRKQTNKDKALQNFDDFYGSVFGNRWKSMRVALLTEHKYIALVNNFGDTEKTIQMLQNDGAMRVSAVYNVGKKIQMESGQAIFENVNEIGKIDHQLGKFFESKREMDLEAIKPENSELFSAPEQLKKPHLSESKEAKDNPTLEFKKPLEQVIQEGSDIDYQRLVDPKFGTSALYEFIPATKIKGMEDWVFESDHYKYYSNTLDFPLKMEMEREFEIPENLHLFTYEKGNVSDFKGPRKSSTGVLSHFLMDGASILPPLMLNIKPGERVLDACAAPGGKSLLMLQSLHPGVLVCNDVQESRVNRIKRIMYQYFYDFDVKWNRRRCFITQEDARVIREYGMYDKILVDVPCTTDRHSVNEDDNNIFKPTRVKERLRIPELQAGILSNCIRLLKPGGSLVYSTCSLSHVQNDGVIHMALQSVFKDHGITVTIKDLSLITQPFQNIFKLENPKGLKYGQMVLPFLPANFGPMYFCKLTRNFK